MALNEITEMAEQGPETAEGIEVIFLSEIMQNLIIMKIMTTMS